MTRVACSALAFLSLSIAGCRTTTALDSGSASAVQAAELPTPDAETLALFKRYCISCHPTYRTGPNVKWAGIAAVASEARRRLLWDDAGLTDEERMPQADSPQRDQLAANPAHRLQMLAALGGGGGGGSDNNGSNAAGSEIQGLILKPGFSLKVWAEVPGARSLAVSPSGTVYVGTGGLGSSNDRVYAVRDTDGDGKGETVFTLASDLNAPNGVAFSNGTLYIAEINRILKLTDIESRLSNPPAPQSIGVSFPSDGHHGWKFLAIGPDGNLYTQVGVPCNICKPPTGDYGKLFRVGTNGQGKTALAKGIRNSVGFTWHPVTGDIWFTENGRDSLGNDVPGDELNRLPANQSGTPDYGYPYCHQGNVAEPDPELAALGSCAQSVKPAAVLEPHAAALGLRFYTGSMFPAEYRHQLFIAQRGSWNRDPPMPPRVRLVRLNAAGTAVVAQEDFISGFQKPDGSRIGRPVDVAFLPDGSMLVSDAAENKIYRVTYASP